MVNHQRWILDLMEPEQHSLTLLPLQSPQLASMYNQRQLRSPRRLNQSLAAHPPHCPNKHCPPILYHHQVLPAEVTRASLHPFTMPPKSARHCNAHLSSSTVTHIRNGQDRRPGTQRRRQSQHRSTAAVTLRTPCRCAASEMSARLRGAQYSQT